MKLLPFIVLVVCCLAVVHSIHIRPHHYSHNSIAMMVTHAGVPASVQAKLFEKLFDDK
jgi:hypothetical protein